MYSPSVNAFLFTIKKGDTVAVDLRAEDDAVNETVEVIVREFNPLAYFITDDASGVDFTSVNNISNILLGSVNNVAFSSIAKINEI